MVLTSRKDNVLKSISLNHNVLKNITDDMNANGLTLKPNNHWLLTEKNEDEALIPEDVAANWQTSFAEEYNNAEKMMDAWVGSEGMKELTEDVINSQISYLEGVDKLGLLKVLKNTPAYYIASDLYSIGQVNLLNTFRDGIDNTRILEVGGGYGRLTEVISNLFHNVKYVMLDAVPGSLYYSKCYLEKVLPNKKIGFYYDDPVLDLEKYDIYICPSWHFEAINRYKYDICINIQSMQEMSQAHVDYYIDLFEKSTRENGWIFLQNARDYVFKGTYNYKSNWRRVCMYDTPSSWSTYQPMEIFERGTGDYSEWNAQVQAMYEYALKKLDEERQQKERLQNQVWKLEYEVSQLKEASSTKKGLFRRKLN